MVNPCCSTLEELLDCVVLCDNCINFKTADLGGKECVVMKEKKFYVAAFFSSINKRSRKRKKRAERCKMTDK